MIRFPEHPTGRVTLRPLVQGQLGEVVACYRETAEFFARVNGDPFVGPLTVQMQFDAAERDPRRVMLGVFTGDGLAGVLDIGIDPEEKSCMVGLLLIRTPLQRRGLAREAVGVLEQALAGSPVTRLRAGVEPANEVAIPIWERLGFKRAGTFPAQDDLGTHFEATLMEKTIHE